MATDPRTGSETPSHESGQLSQSGAAAERYLSLAELAGGRVGDLAGEALRVVRSNPTLFAGLAAVALGALVGLLLGRRRGKGAARRAAEAVEEPARKAGKKASKAVKESPLGRYGELVPLALKLAENPLVRAMVVQAVTKAVARRLK